VLSLSPAKLLIVAVVALVLVGPNKLPQVARQLGGFWKAFRSFSQKIESEVRASVPDLPSSGEIARYARSPISLLDTLAGLDADTLQPDPGQNDQPAMSDGLRIDPQAPLREPQGPTPTPPYIVDPHFDPRWN
jgi:TatA/E family protein of Tat protein translocase